MSAKSSAELKAWAQHAAYTRWAAEKDRSAATQAARDAFIQKFYDEVDPDGVLPEEERHKRAMAARSAWYAGLRAKRLAAQRRRDDAEAELAALDALDGGAA